LEQARSGQCRGGEVKIRDVWIDVKKARQGRITGTADVEVEGRIVMRGLDFTLEYNELKLKLPPNVKLDELQKRKVMRAVTDELLASSPWG